MSGRAAQDATLARKFGVGSARVTKAGLASASGDNTIHTPAAGMKARVYWLGMCTSSNNSAEQLVIAKFAAGGAVKYRWRLGAPGAFSHWEPIEGAVNEPFILNLLNTQGVDWNLTVEDVDPDE